MLSKKMNILYHINIAKFVRTLIVRKGMCYISTYMCKIVLYMIQTFNMCYVYGEAQEMLIITETTVRTTHVGTIVRIRCRKLELRKNRVF